MSYSFWRPTNLGARGACPPDPPSYATGPTPSIHWPLKIRVCPAWKQPAGVAIIRFGKKHNHSLVTFILPVEK